ncbi:MAG: FGGY-family carbohydrate kinase [Omnitrophica WOR_2 bacterium]
MDEVVIGIDLGTQGARVLAVDPAGRLASSEHEALMAPVQSLPEGWIEQSPRDWWQAVRNCLLRTVAQLPSRCSIAGISVDSTSGTILPVSVNGEPFYNAILYNDRRSENQAVEVQEAGATQQNKFGYVFGSSYALPKILWFKQVFPELFVQTHRFIHAADFINGHLTGDFCVTDTSNALKTGYDLLDFRWPDFIENTLSIPLWLLPEVVLPGIQIGQVSMQAAQETGLAPGIPVFAGATDGAAAQIASGAVQPGDWNSTLGTTLVLKGIAREIIPDQKGRVYFHRHPEGWWMPGGASNTGTEWIKVDHPGDDPANLDRLAEPYLPTSLVRYPLAKKGERFPFVHKEASGFFSGEPSDGNEYYAAGLEGLALLERLAYTMLPAIGLEVGERLYITGGGARSTLWSQIRASVLHKVLKQPAVPETAMGAAIIAASGCWYGSLSQAARHMVQIVRSIESNPDWQDAYDDKYAAFMAELTKRDWYEHF